MGRSRSLPARQVERARVVLLAAEGKTDLDIAASLKISNQKAPRLAEAVSAVRFSGPGERCTPTRPETRHLRQAQRGVDPQDDPVQAGQRNALEHADDGR